MSIVLADRGLLERLNKTRIAIVDMESIEDDAPRV